MSETMIQLLSGVGLFFLGIVVGAVFHRSVQGEASKNKRLEQKLAELQARHEKYQAEVSEHFMDTAQAVHTLNKSYREVHEQLAKGASRLCNEEQAEDFLAIGQSNASTDSAAQKPRAEVYTPPMDYAPKNSDADTGTLSETYGITKKEVSSEQEEELLVKEPPRI
ncbi:MULTISPECIES: YhcB family protein [unclassified Oleiphilus]|uniref:YhcB family protein n=3 Tax=Oleiphilus TaxID=141450 RepID=UPI000839274A|nr:MULTISPECIES: DUF1043 family protein [unclassified Oleiphilus]